MHFFLIAKFVLNISRNNILHSVVRSSHFAKFLSIVCLVYAIQEYFDFTSFFPELADNILFLSVLQDAEVNAKQGTRNLDNARRLAIRNRKMKILILILFVVILLIFLLFFYLYEIGPFSHDPPPVIILPSTTTTITKQYLPKIMFCFFNFEMQ